MACESQDVPAEFLDRTSKLDLRDRRANLPFREELREFEIRDEDQFIRFEDYPCTETHLSQAWTSLGRMREEEGV